MALNRVKRRTLQKRSNPSIGAAFRAKMAGKARQYWTFQLLSHRTISL
jgi:hypothetical protein